MSTCCRGKDALESVGAGCEVSTTISTISLGRELGAGAGDLGLLDCLLHSIQLSDPKCSVINGTNTT